MRVFTLIIIILLLTLGAVAQNKIEGCVIARDKSPLEYASVILFHKIDSAYLRTYITDRLGHFSISTDMNPPTELRLKISFLGYKSRIVEIDEFGDIGLIILEEDAFALEGIKVTGTRNFYLMRGTSLVANIEKSPLSNIGTAFDVMEHIPLLNVYNDKIDVFGRGTPIIYINNKKIRSIDELKLLTSADIKTIEVVTLPGAQYDMNTAAVIRITTKKKEGEGFAGLVNGAITKRRNLYEQFNIHLNYVYKELSVYGEFYLIDSRDEEEPEALAFIESAGIHIINDDMKEINQRLGYIGALGLDYNISDNHSIGAKYAPSGMWRDIFRSDSRSQYHKDDIFIEGVSSFANFKLDKDNSGYLNAYYSGKFNDLMLVLTGDFAHGDKVRVGSFHNIYPDNTEEERGSTSSNNYKLGATKLELTYKISERSGLMVGGEYSYTVNDSRYDGFNLDPSLPATRTRSKQHLGAVFVEYNLNINRFGLNAGLRYEIVKFDYRLNSKIQNDQSKTYKDLFPIISVSYSIPEKRINATLSYRRTTSRPSYYQLRGDVQYDSPYSYESGNPELKNSIIDDIGLTFSYKDFYVMGSYRAIKNRSLYVMGQYEDEPITLSTYVNIRSSKSLGVSAVWSPTFFKIWNPRVEAGVTKQFLDLNYNNQIVKYNKPRYHIALNNIIYLPHNFTFFLSGRVVNSYNSGYIYRRHTSSIDASIMKQFFNKSLTVRLGVNDIFRGNKDIWSIDYQNVYSSTRSDGDSRSFYLSATYRFNKIKSYRTRGASEQERDRLGF